MIIWKKKPTPFYIYIQSGEVLMLHGPLGNCLGPHLVLCFPPCSPKGECHLSSLRSRGWDDINGFQGYSLCCKKWMMTGSSLQYSGLSYCLQYWHPIWALVHILAAPLSIQLPENGVGKQWKMAWKCPGPLKKFLLFIRLFGVKPANR